MTVLKEILDWSKGRPVWQRDALRRLVQNGELTDDDIRSLTDICKSTHGLLEQPEVVPLDQSHVPNRGADSAPVALDSIFHHRGVNALAEGQTLKFSRHLTVVYGDNAAGKTGYIRILKSACRARGQEKILGNVISGVAPLVPTVAIKYKVGADVDPREWSGAGEDEFISRVSVFDSQCASVYLTQKTDVAFRPLGLDIFDKLVKASKAIHAKLESEQRALVSTALSAVQAQIPEGTAVAKLLAGITSLTKPEVVKALARLSTEDEARLGVVEKSLLDLQANDPEKLIRQLTLRAGRVQNLVRHLKEVEAALSVEAVTGVFNARTDGRRKSEEAKRLRAATFPKGMLDGTGSEPWSVLWDAARQFSQDLAYPGQEFPVVNNGARCVLCQQDLDHAAQHRLQQFAAFAISSTERELRQLRETFARLRKRFTDLLIRTEAIDETLKEMRLEHELEADAIAAALGTNESRRNAVVLSLAEDRDLAADCPTLAVSADEAGALTEQIAERIKALRTTGADETKKRLVAEGQELRARKLLAENEQTVLDDIERKKKYAAYSLCIDETRTQTITQKSTAVTRAAVTQKLQTTFQTELRNLGFKHVEVELKEVGGTEGVLYHKLVLTRAPGVELPRVVSEGEQRCLSVAAFFAELSTASSKKSSLPSEGNSCRPGTDDCLLGKP